MRWVTNENRAYRVTLGDQWDGGLMSSNNAVGTYELGAQPVRRDQCDGGPMEWAVCGCQLGDQWDRGPVRWGTIGIGRNWVDEWKRGPICSWGLMNWGTNEKRTNELGDQWDGGPMSRGDQWDGGPMEWVMHGCQLGDQWDGRLMSWGTNEMGNQWDGGPMRWGTIGIGRWWGDEWKGGPMRWGTSDMGDQWDGGPMSSNNVLGDQWVGGPMRRGPMRWGTNEMGDQWADPPSTTTASRRGSAVIDRSSVTTPTTTATATVTATATLMSQTTTHRTATRGRQPLKEISNQQTVVSYEDNKGNGPCNGSVIVVWGTLNSGDINLQNHKAPPTRTSITSINGEELESFDWDNLIAEMVPVDWSGLNCTVVKRTRVPAGYLVKMATDAASLRPGLCELWRPRTSTREEKGLSFSL